MFGTLNTSIGKQPWLFLVGTRKASWFVHDRFLSGHDYSFLVMTGCRHHTSSNRVVMGCPCHMCTWKHGLPPAFLDRETRHTFSHKRWKTRGFTRGIYKRTSRILPNTYHIIMYYQIFRSTGPQQCTSKIRVYCICILYRATERERECVCVRVYCCIVLYIVDLWFMLDDFLEFSTTVSVAQLGTSGSSKMTVLLACLAPCEFRSWQGAREKSGCKAKLFSHQNSLDSDHWCWININYS